MKKLTKILIYIFVGLASFVFFFYLAFPYRILKDAIATNVSSQGGIYLSIGDLSPTLGAGMEASDITLVATGGATLKLSKVHVDLSLWRVIIGQIGAEVSIEDAEGGEFSLEANLGLFDLLKGSNLILPRYLAVKADKFVLTPVVNILLAKLAASPSTNSFVRPLLSSIGFSGSISSDISLDLNSSDLSQSTGGGSIQLVKTKLSFDPNMNIPDQQFDKALIKVNIASGQVLIDKSSALSSSDITVTPTGKVNLDSEVDRSKLDLGVNIELKGRLKAQLADILSIFIPNAGSEINLRVEGAIGGRGPSFRVL